MRQTQVFGVRRNHSEYAVPDRFVLVMCLCSRTGTCIVDSVTHPRQYCFEPIEQMYIYL